MLDLVFYEAVDYKDRNKKIKVDRALSVEELKKSLRNSYGTPEAVLIYETKIKRYYRSDEQKLYNWESDYVKKEIKESKYIETFRI